MARPSKPPDQRKQAVTISLSPSTLVILDNLARVQKMNRSQVIDSMLKAKGFNDLGMKALEGHTAEYQVWTPKGKEDDPKACTPYHKDGKCKHQACVGLYSRWGI